MNQTNKQTKKKGNTEGRTPSGLASQHIRREQKTTTSKQS